jgi:thioredoxin-like negative regulator of GroEL
MITAVVRLALVVVLTVGVAADAASEIKWYTDLKEASEAARKRDLPMFIDFWADWCGVCKIMDAEVYTDARVIKAFEEKAIGVRLHFDLQPDVARKYNVPALPYLLFTNSYGTLLVHHRGLLEAEDLAKILEAMPPLEVINRLDRDLQKDKNHFPSLLGMARELRAAGFYQSSNAYYDRASKHRLVRNDPAARESILFDSALNSLELQDGKSAAAALEECLKDFPASPRKADFLVALGRAYALDDKVDKARTVLSAVVRDYPQSSAAVEARKLLESL